MPRRTITASPWRNCCKRNKRTGTARASFPRVLNACSVRENLPVGEILPPGQFLPVYFPAKQGFYRRSAAPYPALAGSLVMRERTPSFRGSQELHIPSREEFAPAADQAKRMAGSFAQTSAPGIGRGLWLWRPGSRILLP